jgi:hypothetical protein
VYTANNIYIQNRERILKSNRPLKEGFFSTCIFQTLLRGDVEVDKYLGKQGEMSVVLKRTKLKTIEINLEQNEITKMSLKTHVKCEIKNCQ